MAELPFENRIPGTCPACRAPVVTPPRGSDNFQYKQIRLAIRTVGRSLARRERSRDTADILIKQIGHFNRVIDRPLRRLFRLREFAVRFSLLRPLLTRFPLGGRIISNKVESLFLPSRQVTILT